MSWGISFSTILHVRTAKTEQTARCAGWSESSLCALKVAKDRKPLHEDSLIRASAARKGHFLGNAVSRLIYQ